MSNDLISIIMPIYNSGGTVKKGVNSVLAQTYTNFELILIDDGSTDDTFTICNKLKDGDDRIKVYRKANGGVSSARNLGVNKSRGEYIVFLDSDDALDSLYLETLLKNHFSNSTLVACGAIVNNGFSSEKAFWQIPNQKVNYHIDEIDELMLDKFLFNVVWNKLYERQIIIENGIIFPEGLSLGEDLLFNLSYLSYIKNIVILNEPLYLYSYCGGLSAGYRQDMFDIIDCLYQKKFELIKQVSPSKLDYVKIDYLHYYIIVLRRYSIHDGSIFKYKYSLDSRQAQQISEELYNKELISKNLYHIIKKKCVVGCILYSMLFFRK